MLPWQWFEEEIARLYRHVYDLVGGHSADLYVEATKHVASYMGQNCQHGGDICQAVELWAKPTIPMPRAPAAPPEMADPIAQTMVSVLVKGYVKHRAKLEENIKTLWAVLWVQCSPSVCNHIEAFPSYEIMKDQSKGLNLLMAIKDLL